MRGWPARSLIPRSGPTHRACGPRACRSATATPSLSGALAYSGPNALTYALDVLVPQLAAATDNNPATPVTDLSKAA